MKWLRYKLRKRWRVEPYVMETGETLVDDPIPHLDFWSRKTAGHEACGLNSIAVLQQSRIRYRVVSLP